MRDIFRSDGDGTEVRGGSTAFSLDWEYSALDIRFHCPPRLRSNR